MARDLKDVDWQAPWLAPYATVGQRVAAGVAQGQSAAQALNVERPANPAGVRFVRPDQRPPGESYEAYIFRSNCCPTREGLHDFFNGLVWLHFPRVKRRLNHLHAAQIARTGIGPTRGPVRDGLTLFDENAAFLQAPEVLWQALLGKQWQRLFVELRPLWRQTQLVLFGHALLEKLVSPRKSITSHVWWVPAATQSIADMDAWMADDVSADKLASRPFVHLPVLGVPGWCQSNEDPTFYQDLSVFRPAKQLSNLSDTLA